MASETAHTQVAIVGAGPAGLTLAALLAAPGSRRSCWRIEPRLRRGADRAGVIEQGAAEILVEAGIGERMGEEGIVHHGIHVQFRRRASPSAAERPRRRAPYRDLRPDRGRQGLIAARAAADLPLHSRSTP